MRKRAIDSFHSCLVPQIETTVEKGKLCDAAVRLWYHASRAGGSGVERGKVTAAVFGAVGFRLTSCIEGVLETFGLEETKVTARRVCVSLKSLSDNNNYSCT